MAKARGVFVPTDGESVVIPHTLMGGRFNSMFRVVKIKLFNKSGGEGRAMGIGSVRRVLHRAMIDDDYLLVECIAGQLAPKDLAPMYSRISESDVRRPQISEEMWANLPKSYEWLRDWEWI